MERWWALQFKYLLQLTSRDDQTRSYRRLRAGLDRLYARIS